MWLKDVAQVVECLPSLEFKHQNHQKNHHLSTFSVASHISLPVSRFHKCSYPSPSGLLMKIKRSCPKDSSTVLGLIVSFTPTTLL
jgi:hypothetical protein